MSELSGTWFHSHEEAVGGRIVYRDASFEFPRSRAPRRSLTFEADGTCRFGAPGPVDAPVFTEGAWEVTDDRLRLSAPGWEEVYRIESLEESRLVLRRHGERAEETR